MYSKRLCLSSRKVEAAALPEWVPSLEALNQSANTCNQADAISQINTDFLRREYYNIKNY
jgi:hypothetical protein